MNPPNGQPRALTALPDDQLIEVLREELARVRAEEEQLRGRLGEYVPYEPTIREEMEHLSRQWLLAERERDLLLISRDEYAAAVRVLSRELAGAQTEIDRLLNGTPG